MVILITTKVRTILTKMAKIAYEGLKKIVMFGLS